MREIGFVFIFCAFLEERRAAEIWHGLVTLKGQGVERGGVKVVGSLRSLFFLWEEKVVLN